MVGELRQMVVDVLGDVLVWRLNPSGWERVGRGLEAMARALAAGDATSLSRAVADVEMAGPYRISGLEESAALPVPELYRERVNELIHSLSGVPGECEPGPPAGAGDSGRASPDA